MFPVHPSVQLLLRAQCNLPPCGCLIGFAADGHAFHGASFSRRYFDEWTVNLLLGRHMFPQVSCHRVRYDWKTRVTTC